MATSGPAAFSTRSFYGSRARAQRDRPHVQLIEPDFGESDKESDYDEDEANFPDEESDYSSPSEDENGSDSHDDDVGVVDDDDTESSEVEGEAAGSSKTGNTSQNVRWRKRQPVSYDVAFKGEPFPPPPLEDKTPLQYFKQFFDDNLIDLLVEQTNLYSVQTTGTSIGLDHNEMEMYMGMLVMMSIIKLPQMRMYWGKATQIPTVAEVMPVNRFEKIKQFFHCNDNSKNLPNTHKDFDKLFKVRPVLDSVREKCQQLPQEENHSVDEQIIPTKSRTSLKQYLPNKPNKWGIKVWARCGVSGILYDFEVYTGKTTKAEAKPELLMGGNVICRLTQSLPKNVNHKVFFDNFFSSIAIMNHLKKDGFWAVATIRKDRLKGADKHMLAEKELKKKGRGSFDYVVEANSGVTVIRWFDNGLVQLLSNYVGNNLAAQARRWSRKERRFISIDRPAMVVEYNSNMGGVDLCDMLMSMYRIRHRSTKYYMHMVFYCIGVAVVNGWLLYRRHMTQKNVPRKNHMSLLMFQTEIAVGLCKAGKSSAVAARPRGRPSSTSPVPAATPSRKRKATSAPNPTRDVQFDQCGHFPMFQEKQQRCRHCKTGYSHLKCCKCDVHLCLVKSRNCFNAFHGVNSS